MWDANEDFRAHVQGESFAKHIPGWRRRITNPNGYVSGTGGIKGQNKESKVNIAKRLYGNEAKQKFWIACDKINFYSMSENE